MIVVDTDVVIDFFSDIKPGSEALSRLISREEVALASISAFELYAGIKGKKRLRQIEMLLQSLTILPLSVIEAAMAGRVYTQLKSTGLLIGTHDILIAGICLANGLPLYTKNEAHFSRIEGLRLVSAEEVLESEHVRRANLP